MALPKRMLSARSVFAALGRALTYTLASLTCLPSFFWPCATGKPICLSEAWYSPQGVWRNVEATWTNLLHLNVLTLLPASLLSTLGHSEMASHTIAALVTVALALLFTGGVRGDLAPLPDHC